MQLQGSFKLIKRVAGALGLVLLVVIVWYASGRALAPSRAVTSYELDSSAASSSATDSNVLNIGSFNIAHGRGGILGAKNWQSGDRADLLDHLDQIAAQIRAQKLDVIVLNEIDFSSKWSFNINQARYIAEQAGYSYAVEQRNMDVSFPFFDFKFGNAILSRYPIVKSDFVNFEPLSKWEDLFVGNHDGLLSIVDTPFGELGIIAVHLEYRDEAIRVSAAKMIDEIAKTMAIPVVAAGDYNSAPSGYPKSKISASGENALNHLLDATEFQAAKNVSPNQFTFPSQNPSQVIDWILVRGDVQLSNAQVVRSELSDHFLISGQLTVAN